MDKLIIIGINSTAAHLFEFIKHYNLFHVIGFAVDRKYIDKDSFKGLPVYAIDELEKIIDKRNIYLFVAMLWNKLNSERRAMYERLKQHNFKFANIISPTAQIRRRLKGDNCWFHDYTVVQNDAVIGSNVAAMAFTLIGADTTIGSHCFFGAKSTVGGGSKIGEQSFVGINSTIFDDTVIGKKCIIGACTAVKRNMPDFTILKTNTDNFVMKTYNKDEIESKLLFSKNVRT
jgi:sugar O-acyltransferase (sialic acid O-acetyltransferase NeuD family)